MSTSRNTTTAQTQDDRAALDAYARHAAAANGFGDAGLVRSDAARPAATASRLDNARVVRVDPARVGVTDTLVAVARAAVRTLRVALVRWRQRRRARMTDEALSGLDDRALRDLGLDRSEISSVATGIGRRGDSTRARMWQVRQQLYI